MNQKLFDGYLGECDFQIFTRGRGAEGHTLGRFSITNKRVKGERSSRRMFLYNALGYKEYINKNNFAMLCRPLISLNGNYRGTERAFLNTLIHEMCHYYTYMYGYIPKQGHGVEFREIAAHVSYKSNGEITIQRLASAEEMQELELSDEMKARQKKKLDNKKSSITALFRFMVNGQIELTTTSSNEVINRIKRTYESDDVRKVTLTKDSDLIDILFTNGYRKNFRTWRYWNVEGKDWVKDLGKYDMMVYANPKYGESETKKEEPRQPRQIFSIKTSNGVFECEFNGDYEVLKNNIKAKFPKMRDEVIDKIMNNKANFRVMESKRNIKSIIREVIEEFMDKDMGNDEITFSPDMNLGLRSPLEME